MGQAQGVGGLPLRKSPFRTFTLEFVEHERGLVIAPENSEPGHRSSHIAHDRLLNEQGYVVLRLWRREAERDLYSALHLIRRVPQDLAV